MIKMTAKNVGTTPYGLGDFLINEEKFLYPKAFDKKLKITSGGAFSKLSILFNTLNYQCLKIYRIHKYA